MFGKCGKVKNDTTNGKSAELRIAELESEVESLKKQNDEYLKQLRGQVSKASFSVNWELMQAFSVERMLANGVVKTVIGYFDPTQPSTSSAVREWTLYCSPEEHERLVEDFKTYVSRYKERVDSE